VDRQFWEEEEEDAGLIRRTWEEEEDYPTKSGNSFLERGLTGDVRNLAAGNSEVCQLAVGQTAQLVHRLAVTAPVAEVLDQVHRRARSLGKSIINLVASQIVRACLFLKRECCIAVMRIVHCNIDLEHGAGEHESRRLRN